MKKKILMMIGAAIAGAAAVKGYEVVKEYKHNKRQEELRAWARSFADDYEDEDEEDDEKVWFNPDEEFDTDLDADWDLEPKENACCCECAVDLIDERIANCLVFYVYMHSYSDEDEPVLSIADRDVLVRIKQSSSKIISSTTRRVIDFTSNQCLDYLL